MSGLLSILNNAGGGYRRVLRLQLLALLPVCIAAVVNGGYQYLILLAAEPGRGGDDLRSNLAQALGASHENPGLYDFLAAGMAHFLPMLLLALAVGGFWERIIAARRERPLEPGFILIALLFTLMLPGAAAFSHVVYGMSFAILLGKGIFGGDGKTFLSPALLGLAIVQVSFPSASGEHPLWQGLAGYSGSDAIAMFHRGRSGRRRHHSMVGISGRHQRDSGHHFGFGRGAWRRPVIVCPDNLMAPAAGAIDRIGRSRHAVQYCGRGNGRGFGCRDHACPLASAARKLRFRRGFHRLRSGGLLLHQSRPLDTGIFNRRTGGADPGRKLDPPRRGYPGAAVDLDCGAVNRSRGHRLEYSQAGASPCLKPPSKTIPRRRPA